MYWKPLFLTAVKTQIVQRMGAGRCAYHTTDTMAGLLAPVVRMLFAKWILRGFEETASALKPRAEALHQGRVA